MNRAAAPSRTGSLSTPLWLLGFLFAGFVVLWEIALREWTLALVWYSFLIIGVTAFAADRARLNHDFDIFEPIHMVLAFFVISFPVRALLALLFEEEWIEGSVPAVMKALTVAMVGALGFSWGYRWRFGTPWKTLLSRFYRPWQERESDVVSLVLLLVSAASFVAVSYWGGTISYFILVDPDVKGPDTMKPWFYYLLWAAMFIQVGALIQMGAYLSQRRKGWVSFLYLSLAMVTTVWVSRISTILLLLMVAIAFHYLRKRISVRVMLGVALVATSYLALAGLYREWISPIISVEDVGEWTEVTSEKTKLVVRYIIGNFEQLRNLEELVEYTPQELPYQWGATFSPVLLKPIPRVVMPNKPLGAGGLFTRHFLPLEYEAGFVTTVGAWGEWYMNFSWIGVVLGMGVIGALASAGYRAMSESVSVTTVVIYSVFVASLLYWLRSDFNAAVTQALFYVLPLALGIWYVTRRPQKAPGVQGP